MVAIFGNLPKDWQYKASAGLDQKESDRLHGEFKQYYALKAFNHIAEKAPVLTDSAEALFSSCPAANRIQRWKCQDLASAFPIR